MVQVDIDTAIFNPASVFKSPEEILQDAKIHLTKEEKIRALETWRYDIQLRRIAEAENMHSTHDQKDVDLEIAILHALDSLGVVH